MTPTARTPHPTSAAAILRSAEAHALAAAVLRARNPAAAEVHADLASALRAKASPDRPT